MKFRMNAKKKLSKDKIQRFVHHSLIAGVTKPEWIWRLLMKKAYKKPILVAKNNPTGNFAAGCPAQWSGVNWQCQSCFRPQ